VIRHYDGRKFSECVLWDFGSDIPRASKCGVKKDAGWTILAYQTHISPVWSRFTRKRFIGAFYFNRTWDLFKNVRFGVHGCLMVVPREAKYVALLATFRYIVNWSFLTSKWFKTAWGGWCAPCWRTCEELLHRMRCTGLDEMTKLHRSDDEWLFDLIGYMLWSKQFIIIYIPQRRRYMYLPVFVCLSVCEQDYSKRRAWIWMKCCVSTDVGTWTNW